MKLPLSLSGNFVGFVLFILCPIYIVGMHGTVDLENNLENDPGIFMNVKEDENILNVERNANYEICLLANYDLLYAISYRVGVSHHCNQNTTQGQIYWTEEDVNLAEQTVRLKKQVLVHNISTSLCLRYNGQYVQLSSNCLNDDSVWQHSSGNTICKSQGCLATNGTSVYLEHCNAPRNLLSICFEYLNKSTWQGVSANLSCTTK